MRRWNLTNINTPEYFDGMWRQWAEADFDHRRMEAMTDCVMPYWGRVLDVGAGYLGCGMYVSLQKSYLNCQIYAVDFSMEAAQLTVQRCGDNLHYVLGDIHHLPFGSAVFHHAFLGEVIEHVEDPVRLLREIKRVLLPDCCLCVSTVNMHCATAKRNGCKYPDHVWDFTQDSLKSVCQQVFDSVEMVVFGNYYIGWMR